MNNFDKVIGYDSIKKELLQVCDMINNREEYEKLGAKMPNGIILDGDPGLGKSLLAKCFIEESGLKAFTVRKNKSENFSEYISEVFEEAKANTPCIVFLDDMDKFANEDMDHRDADEYVTVQTCIDEIRDKGVFIIATVNDIYKLPDSLVRAGRFDRNISVKRPCNDDCRKIIAYYLSEKPISGDLNLDDISKMINCSSCAELETIVNEAAIHAAYERKQSIDANDFIYAALRIEHNTSGNSEQGDNEETKRTAVHEAGHIVMSEIMLPGSVGFASIRRSDRKDNSGFVQRCKEFENTAQHILVCLAGKAASELYFGMCDTGCESDIQKAYRAIRDEISENGTRGFGMVDVATRRFPETSESMNSRSEAVTQAELERYMYKAREIMVKNKEFLDKTVETLLEKENLLCSDIKKIRESVGM